jgi:hypothetical protein
VRGAAPSYDAAVNATVPSPEPAAPASIEIQVAAVVAAQRQPAGALTVAVDAPPAAPNVDIVVETEKVQAGDAGSGGRSSAHADRLVAKEIAARMRPAIRKLTFEGSIRLRSASEP